MQIALISWRTLGASELRLLASLLSLACVCFFHCVVCFLAVIVVVFEVLCPPPTTTPTTTRLPPQLPPFLSLPFPAPLVSWLESSLLSWRRWRPGLPLNRPTSGKEADWELLGGGAEQSAADVRDLGPLSGISTLMWAGARLSLCQMFCVFFKKRSDTCKCWLWKRNGSEVQL